MFFQTTVIMPDSDLAARNFTSAKKKPRNVTGREADSQASNQPLDIEHVMVGFVSGQAPLPMSRHSQGAEPG
jgi:hypothetical protein